MEWLEYQVTWTDPDGGENLYEARGRDLIAEADALVRARAVLDREERDRPTSPVVIRHRTVVSSHGPWVSQAVDATVVRPALERVKATARLTPSASVGGAPVRTMRDGSQSFGPYLDPDRDPVIDDA